MTTITPSHHVLTDVEADAYRGTLRHLVDTKHGSLVVLGLLLLDLGLIVALGPTQGVALAIPVTVLTFFFCAAVSLIDETVDPLAELDEPALRGLAKVVEEYPEIRTWIHEEIAAGKTLRMRDYKFACQQANALAAKAAVAVRRQKDEDSFEEARRALLAAAGLGGDRAAAQQ
ncbi:hypothetical protein H8Z72_22580 (plasmid) [Xanthomonas citri pv. citri]|uniref:hypothetical protein n=1 Tax=Xanthomonas citri TaxID=346 RepID=UPI001932CAED|nr:hypothetical protein [Xanthomonas citri]QRD62683.1 hypothetical protein H8Z74_23605 [Xanthomonas citri pv. citri]QRD67218.1 hypothetical protein H8Z73_22585 [Xanthomonas citri pv. citri]QRD71737.1 hypothetical protein H8Z72_22580 [Xanthomonas citri pv. citri]